MTALVLPGLLTIAVALAVTGTRLWMMRKQSGALAGRNGLGPSAIHAIQPVPGELPRSGWRASTAQWSSGAEDDTDLDYYDTSSGNIWRPDAEPAFEDLAQ